MKLKLKLFLRYKQIFIESYCMLCLNGGQVFKYCAFMDNPHNTTWRYQAWLTTAFTEWNALLTILALGCDRLAQCHFKYKRTCSCHFPPEWTTKVYQTVVHSSLLQSRYPQEPTNLRNPPGTILITILPIVYRAYISQSNIPYRPTLQRRISWKQPTENFANVSTWMLQSSSGRPNEDWSIQSKLRQNSLSVPSDTVVAHLLY